MQERDTTGDRMRIGSAESSSSLYSIVRARLGSVDFREPVLSHMTGFGSINSLEDVGDEIAHYVIPSTSPDPMSARAFHMVRSRLLPAYHGGALTCTCLRLYDYNLDNYLPAG